MHFRTVFILPFLIGFIASIMACTHKPIRQKQVAVCAGVDWWELGRADGVLGLSGIKIRDHELRCGSGLRRSEIESYMNGRDAGLIDYCSAASGFAAGKNGVPYQKVCPEHLEAEFLVKFNDGAKVRRLEQETADLEERIESLVSRVLATQSASHPLNTQIERLKQRRVEIETEIDAIESEIQL